MNEAVTVFLAENPTLGNTPASNAINAWVNSAYLGTDLASVSIKIVDQSESQMLNEQYLQKNKPTNVLSFPMGVREESGLYMLGDIAICAPVIEREASEQQKSVEAHWAHMVVHGMLHLQGYDHMLDEEAFEMEGLEKNILQTLGYKNPYEV